MTGGHAHGQEQPRFPPRYAPVGTLAPCGTMVNTRQNGEKPCAATAPGFTVPKIGQMSNLKTYLYKALMFKL